MLQFLALTSRGLFDVLESELQSLGFSTRKTLEGIYFQSDWEGCYRANLWLRSATRILYPISQFKARDTEQLYQGIQKINFTDWIGPQQTFKINSEIAKTENDPLFKDARFVNLKIKDAIVDQFRDKYGTRPSIDKDLCDLPVFVKIDGDNISVALDTSGQSLSKRGYRKYSVNSSLREHLAAGLLMISKWDKKSPLVDPMCGAGTFLIEGAMMALNIAPGLLRKFFTFQKWKNFRPHTWQEIINQAVTHEARESQLSFPIYGFDKSSFAIKCAKANALTAGVDAFIHFQKKEISDLTSKAINANVHTKTLVGLIITNPPYGKRLKYNTATSTLVETNEEQKNNFFREDNSLNDSNCYRALSHTLKTQFQGWTAWILSGKVSAFTQLKASCKYPVRNGQIDCRFLCYQIHSNPLTQLYVNPNYRNFYKN